MPPPVGDAQRLLDELLSPLRAGRGVRIICLGVTGSGKSYALQKIVERVRTMVDVVYIADDGPESDRWPGQRRIDLRDAADKPLVRLADGGSNVVVFTGDVLNDRPIDMEALAADVWNQARDGFSVALVADEARRFTKSPGRWIDPHGRAPLLYTEGRKLAASGLGATNFPQDAPREMLSQSDKIIFLSGGAEVDYMREKRFISAAAAERIAHLPMQICTCVRMGAPEDPRLWRF